MQAFFKKNDVVLCFCLFLFVFVLGLKYLCSIIV